MSLIYEGTFNRLLFLSGVANILQGKVIMQSDYVETGQRSV